MPERGASEEFEELVSQALAELPEGLAERMDNVEIVIEDYPDASVADDLDGDSDGLLGLYQGIPLTSRDAGYYGVLPDRITIYRKNIERVAKTKEGLREAVRKTVIHEIAHHFGIDDDRLTELGWG